jgi:hypothetical protein
MNKENAEKNTIKPDKSKGQSAALGRPQSFAGVFPGLVLVLLGVLFLLSQYGYLQGEWWQYFLVGLGVIFVILAWVQHLGQDSGWPRLGLIFTGLLLIAIGLLFLFDPNNWWPLLLIAAGLVLIIRYVFLRKRAG